MKKKNKNTLEKINAYEMMKNASKLHTEILDRCFKSDLPASIVVGILECTKHTILNYADLSIYQALLKIGEKKKKGGRKNEM